MGRLKSIPPKVAAIGTRLQPALARAEAEAKRFRDRDKVQAWRAWYKTQRWRDLRRRILQRDDYVCARSGILCSGKYPADDSPVVDHIRPHRGDEGLFWDPANLQTLSKGVHDREKQAEERADGW